MPTYVQLCETSGVEAAGEETHSAAFAKKPPAEFPALPEAASPSSQGIISTGLCLQTLFSRPWDPTTTVVQMHI